MDPSPSSLSFPTESTHHHRLLLWFDFQSYANCRCNCNQAIRSYWASRFHSNKAGKGDLPPALDRLGSGKPVRAREYMDKADGRSLWERTGALHRGPYL